VENNNDEIIRLLTEVHSDVQNIKTRVTALENNLAKMAGGLAVVVSHDQERKKKSKVWPPSLAKKLYPDYQE
jgi:hypothetical protein